MDEKKEESLDILRAIKEKAEADLKNKPGYEKCKVINVIHYTKKVELINRATEKKEEFDLCVVEIEDPDKLGQTMELYYLDGEEIDFDDLIIRYESPKPIRDVVNKTKENEELPKEEQSEELRTEKLSELEKEQTEKEEEEKEDENDQKVEELQISNLKGEIDLEQQVNGETLRKIIGLEEDYVSIAPVRAASVGVKSSAEYCFVAIKKDRTCTVLGEDKLIEDRQEGVNPYDRDLKVNNDGSLSNESSISGFKIVNRSNLYLSVRFDEGSSTRETTISDRSGRKGDQEIEHELHKSGDRVIDSDARESLMVEDGIEGSDEMIERQKEHEKLGCENDRVENIDTNQNNNIHNHDEIYLDEKIAGTNMTWRQFASECGFRGEGAIEKATKKFMDYKKSNPDLSNKELVECVIEKENENFRSPDIEHIR